MDLAGVLEIRDGEDLRQWSRLEIRLNTIRRSTIPQNNSSNFYVLATKDSYFTFADLLYKKIDIIAMG